MSQLCQNITYQHSQYQFKNTNHIKMHKITQNKKNCKFSSQYAQFLCKFTVMTTKMHIFANLLQKSSNFNFQSLFSLLRGITNLSYQIDEGNGTSCQPRPPMLHPPLGGSSITPLRKPTLCSFNSLLVYQGFDLEPPHSRGCLEHEDLKQEEWTRYHRYTTYAWIHGTLHEPKTIHQAVSTTMQPCQPFVKFHKDPHNKDLIIFLPNLLTPPLVNLLDRLNHFLRNLSLFFYGWHKTFVGYRLFSSDSL